MWSKKMFLSFNSIYSRNYASNVYQIIDAWNDIIDVLTFMWLKIVIWGSEMGSTPQN